jgi:hypothetical protein
MKPIKKLRASNLSEKTIRSLRALPVMKSILLLRSHGKHEIQTINANPKIMKPNEILPLPMTFTADVLAVALQLQALKDLKFTNGHVSIEFSSDGAITQVTISKSEKVEAIE